MRKWILSLMLAAPVMAGGLPPCKPGGPTPCEPTVAAPCPTCAPCTPCQQCPPAKVPCPTPAPVVVPACPDCPDPCPEVIVHLPPVEAAARPGWLFGVGAGTNLDDGYMGEVELLAPSRRWSLFAAYVHTEDDTIRDRTIDSYYSDDEGDDTPVRFEVRESIRYETDSVFVGGKLWFGRR